LVIEDSTTAEEVGGGGLCFIALSSENREAEGMKINY
jgi:hypothetical protein